MTEVRTVRATAAQKPVIARLVQLNLYDMTGDMPFPVGEDGLFQYDFLDRFWQHPYLIYVGEELAGFALVIDECPITGTTPCWFMAEFFVLKGYRRRGVGGAAFAQIAGSHAGPWHVATIERNRGATAFWNKVLSSRVTQLATRHHFDEEDWIVQAFDLPAAAE